MNIIKNNAKELENYWRGYEASKTHARLKKDRNDKKNINFITKKK